MGALPLEPQIAAALVAAGAAGCAAEVAVVAAVLCVRSIWYGSPRSAALREAQMRFAVAEGAAPAALPAGVRKARRSHATALALLPRSCCMPALRKAPLCHSELTASIC